MINISPQILEISLLPLDTRVTQTIQPDRMDSSADFEQILEDAIKSADSPELYASEPAEGPAPEIQGDHASALAFASAEVPAPPRTLQRQSISAMSREESLLQGFAKAVEMLEDPGDDPAMASALAIEAATLIGVEQLPLIEVDSSAGVESVALSESPALPAMPRDSNELDLFPLDEGPVSLAQAEQGLVQPPVLQGETVAERLVAFADETAMGTEPQLAAIEALLEQPLGAAFFPRALAAIEDESPQESDREKVGDKKAARVVFEKVDLRTRTVEGAEKPLEGEGPIAEPQELTLAVDLRGAPAGPTGELTDAHSEGPFQSFQDLLARELQEHVSSDIIRHAQMVLRDGGEGTIRLSLKPETLGNIKIRLEMTENKITGTIILDSAEALRAFEQEMPGIQQAFLDSGYDGASLELALNSGANRENLEDQAMPFFSERLAAERYDGLLLDFGDEGPIQRMYGAPLINVLV